MVSSMKTRDTIFVSVIIVQVVQSVPVVSGLQLLVLKTVEQHQPSIPIFLDEHMSVIQSSLVEQHLQLHTLSNNTSHCLMKVFLCDPNIRRRNPIHSRLFL